MSVSSLWFLIACAIVAIVFHLLPGKVHRQVFLSVVNTAFLVPLVPNLKSWACLVFFILATYICALLVKGRSSAFWVFTVIALVVTAFLFIKRYTIVHWMVPFDLWQHLTIIELVGLSYMLFKFIHVLVDRWQGQLAPFSFAAYANYQLAFFTLLAGPIQRYNDFHRSWTEMDMEQAQDEGDTLRAWTRILTGMLKLTAVAPLAWYVYDQTALELGPEPVLISLRQFALYFYAYPVYLYFNFAGYTDVAIGSARLLGFQLPENFNRPYFARNVNDFWNRWHITLTHWIRDYLFMTSYKAAAERFPRASKYLGYGLLFFALTVAGLWHGATGRFAAFGMISGFGAAVSQAYGDFLKTRLGRAGFRRYQKSRLIHAVAIVININFVCFSMVFFSSGTTKALTLLLGASRQLLISVESVELYQPDQAKFFFIVILGALLVTVWKQDTLFSLLEMCGTWLTRTTSSLYRLVLVQTALIVILFLFRWALEQPDPAVVYMQF